MPIYNCELFVAAAVESMLQQTFNDFELIIIDDCSTDGTVGLLDSYKDGRIRLFKKPENTGYIPSLNLALEMARGKYIARMDGDDISHITRLEKQTDFLEQHPEIVLCGTWYELMATKEVVKNPAAAEDIKIALLDYCALGHPTVMFRKQFFKDHNLIYDAGYYPAEDYELWTRIARIGKMANLPEVLLSYRTHPDQVSARDQNAQVSNAYKCKIRMMCYPLDPASALDTANSSRVVRREKIHDAATLDNLACWLDRLFYRNKHAGFYPDTKFKKYIEEQKAAIIRSFYLHQTAYNPKTLSRFNKSYRQYFTLNELFRFAFKCILFWK